MITRDDLWEKLTKLPLQDRSDVLCYLFGYCRSTDNKGFFEGLEMALGEKPNKEAEGENHKV